MGLIDNRFEENVVTTTVDAAAPTALPTPVCPAVPEAGCRTPAIARKATLALLLRRATPGLRLNEHIEADGPTVFAHACKLGLEGIVSKRKGSSYRSGRSPDWLKAKNPACAAVKREEEEDWGR